MITLKEPHASEISKSQVLLTGSLRDKHGRTTYSWSCVNGHEFVMRASQLARGKYRCPACTKSSMSYTLDEQKSEIVSRGYHLLSTSGPTLLDRIVVICPQGHEWSTTYKLFKNHDCKHCRGSGINRRDGEDTIKEFVAKAGYQLLGLAPGRHGLRIEVQCKQKHEPYTVDWQSFKLGKRCRACHYDRQRRTLLDIQSRLPDGYAFLDKWTNNESYHWVECDRGHRYQALGQNILEGKGCPTCHAEDNHYNETEILEALTRIGYVLVSFDPLEIKCDQGHTWRPRRKSAVMKNGRCYTCYLASSQSAAEREIGDYMESLLGRAVSRRDQSFGVEFDLYDHDSKVAVEYCGLYWHTEAFKGKWGHFNKLKIAAENKLRLFTIFEDEWLYKKEIVKDRIAHVLGKSNPLNARDLTLVELPNSEVRTFFEGNHIQGHVAATYAAALIKDGIVYGAVSLGRPNRVHVSPNGLEIKRIAIKVGFNVRGGTSKLLKWAKEKTIQSGFNELITFIDLRYGTGEALPASGFVFKGNSQPSPWLVSRDKRFSYQSVAGKQNKMPRIFDCGHGKWVWRP